MFVVADKSEQCPFCHFSHCLILASTESFPLTIISKSGQGIVTGELITLVEIKITPFLADQLQNSVPVKFHETVLAVFSIFTDQTGFNYRSLKITQAYQDLILKSLYALKFISPCHVTIQLKCILETLHKFTDSKLKLKTSIEQRNAINRYRIEELT